MPTQTITAKIFSELLGPASTWEPNWGSWQITTSNTMNTGTSFGSPAYSANYPNTTDGELGEPFSNPFDDGSAEVSIGTPTYIGYVSGKGHEWNIAVDVTAPAYFWAPAGAIGFDFEGAPMYLPFEYLNIVVYWLPDTVDVEDADPDIINLYISQWYFVGGVTLRTETGTALSLATLPTVTQTNEETDEGIRVEASSTEPNGPIAFWGWQIIDADYNFLAINGVPENTPAVNPYPLYTDEELTAVRAEMWGPYVALGDLLELELEDDQIYLVRVIAIDEHGYARGTSIEFEGAPQHNVFLPIQAVSGWISAFSDFDRVSYLALKSGDDLIIQQAVAGAPTLETKHTLANHTHPSLYQCPTRDRQRGQVTIYLLARDKDAGQSKLYQSDDYAEGFEFMATSPFDLDTYKPPKGCGLLDAGHAQAAIKKGTSEIWFARSWDGENWFHVNGDGEIVEGPVHAFTLEGVRDISIYQEALSGSDVIVIVASRAEDTHLSASAQLGAYGSWDNYEVITAVGV